MLVSSPKAAVVAATTTWNPGDHGAGVTLTGGNLIATGSAANAFGRASASHSTGKFYYEFTGNTFAGTELNVGLANGSVALSTGDLFGGTDRAGYRWNDSVYFNASSAAFQGATLGDTFGVAIDLSGQKIWVSNNGTTWTGAGDPAAGTGGQSFAGITGTSWFPAFVLLNAGGNKITANFGGSAYAFTPPLNFNNW